MIIYLPKGDIFTTTAEVVVNPVNCQGIMGKGLARAFKERYPDNFEAYYWACCAKKVKIGDMFIYEYKDGKPFRAIVNFPTKIVWQRGSKIEYINEGLMSLCRWLKRERVKSIAVPRLGCGNGGLEWPIVKLFLEKHFKQLPDIEFQIYG